MASWAAARKKKNKGRFVLHYYDGVVVVNLEEDGDAEVSKGLREIDHLLPR